MAARTARTTAPAAAADVTRTTDGMTDIHAFATIDGDMIPVTHVVDAYVNATGAARAAVRRAASTAIADAVRAARFDAATAWSDAIAAMDAHRDVNAAPTVDYAAAIASRVVAMASAVYAMVAGDARPDGIDADAASPAAIRAAIAAMIGADIADDAAPSDVMRAIAFYADGNGGADAAAIARYVTPRVSRAGGRRDVGAAIADAADAGAFTSGTRYTFADIARIVAGTRDDGYAPSSGAVRNRFVDATGAARADIAAGWTVTPGAVAGVTYGA